MTTSVPFELLKNADLVLDQIYEGGKAGNAGDDPIHHLLPVGIQGGFRPKGSIKNSDVQLLVLYTSGMEPEWPDRLDPYTGVFTYFGDNRMPGKQIHDTKKLGNHFLKAIFGAGLPGEMKRENVPPIFVFEKTGEGRSVRFKGLAVPGVSGTTQGDDLTAVWRVQAGERFQNYRARFTVLDVGHISRAWIDAVSVGNPFSEKCPEPWRDWVFKNQYLPLITEHIGVRGKAEQEPVEQEGKKIIERIRGYFNDDLQDPIKFERCAVEIWRMIAPSTGVVDLTRPWRDGGRDAIGSYLLGPTGDRLAVEFALEAKCWKNSIGVKEVSRLISRLRHRQFGVFVTTSYFNSQAYKEIRSDNHPVVMVSGQDIVEALATSGLTTLSQVEDWLHSTFPKT